MNLLDRLTKPPEVVTIDGEEYTLNGNYKNCLLTMLALWDNELLEWEKADIILNNMYSEPYPENTNEAIRLAVSYLQQNREEKKQNEAPALDIEQDWDFIYDAFLAKGIDLDKSDMTLWQLMAHMRELPEGCHLSNIVRLRLLSRKGKLTKEDKAQIQRYGEDVVYLKSKKTDGWEPW